MRAPAPSTPSGSASLCQSAWPSLGNKDGATTVCRPLRPCTHTGCLRVYSRLRINGFARPCVGRGAFIWACFFICVVELGSSRAAARGAARRREGARFIDRERFYYWMHANSFGRAKSVLTSSKECEGGGGAGGVFKSEMPPLLHLAKPWTHTQSQSNCRATFG